MLATVSKFGLFLIRFLIFLSTPENTPTVDQRKSTRTRDNLRATAKIRLFTPTDAILSVG